MAIDPTYQQKAQLAADAQLGAGKAVVGVRVADANYSEQTHCTVVVGGVTTRYEVDHVDGTGKPRTPDEVAALVTTLTGAAKVAVAAADAKVN